ncbi:tail fiber/spike domain-containing protein [Klebsiella michiganensis]
MAAINESREWADDIYLIARQDKVLGGAGGIANIQAAQLAARTLFLRDKTDELNTRAMRVVGSFENGATVTSRNQLVQFGQDNGLYCWKGYYPEGGKVVPAGSTPANTGGTGSQGWDAYDNDILRNEIAPYIKAIGYFMHEEGVDVTADLQAFIYSHYRTVIPRQSYRTLIKSNVVIPSSRELVIHNDVEQITDEVDTWSVNHVISKYPMFRIPPGATDTIVRGKGWLWAVYEGVAAEGGENSVEVITRPRIEVNVAGKLKDASLNNYSRFGGITAYKAIDIDVTGSKVFHCGIRPTWDAVNLKRVGGGANGIGFYSCRGMKGHRVWTYRCGGNGIFTNASFSPNFQLCQNISNGLSGIQHGPGGNADQGQICNNNNSLNVADGIDIRWTGSGVASVKLQLNGNYHYRNGYFDEDMTKPTQDGSGLATIAYVSGVDMNGNTSIESAGSGLYLQGCASVKGTGNTASVYTAKEGIYLGGGTVSDIRLDVLDISTRGTALSFGGSSAFYDINLKGKFNSTESYGAVTGSASVYSNVNISGDVYTKRHMYLLGGNWSGTAFFSENGANINIGNIDIGFRSVKFRSKNGSLIISGNLSNLDVSGLDSQSETGRALQLRGCTGLHGYDIKLRTVSGIGLDCIPWEGVACNKVSVSGNLYASEAAGGKAYSMTNVGEVTFRDVVDVGPNTVTGNPPRIKDAYALEGSGQWAATRLKAGSVASVDIAVSGAVMGDMTIASLDQVTGSATLSAKVISANTVRVSLTNNTAADIDIAAGVVKASVWRRK